METAVPGAYPLPRLGNEVANNEPAKRVTSFGKVQAMARPPLTDNQQSRAERLVRPWLATLLRTAQYLTRQPEEAEDLVQETVIKAMQAIDSYREGTNAKAWLMTILRRAHIDRARASQRRPNPLSLNTDEAPEPQAAEQESAGAFDEQWDDPEAMLEAFGDEQIIDALQSLPGEIRWTLLLVDVEQMDHADAAQVLSVPLGTVKSRAHRGRKLLRDRLHAFAQDRGWINPQ